MSRAQTRIERVDQQAEKVEEADLLALAERDDALHAAAGAHEQAARLAGQLEILKQSQAEEKWEMSE